MKCITRKRSSILTVLAHSAFVTLCKRQESCVDSDLRRRTKRGRGEKRKNFPKCKLFPFFRLLHDLSRSPNLKADLAPFGPLGHYLRNAEHKLPPGKSTSGRKIQDYYGSWRTGLPQDIGIRTDSVRLFSDEQKLEMLQRDGAICPMCGKALSLADAEGDHYPIAWRDGGRTVTENGRMVHKTCHIRGRPGEVIDFIPDF